MRLLISTIYSLLIFAVCSGISVAQNPTEKRQESATQTQQQTAEQQQETLNQTILEALKANEDCAIFVKALAAAELTELLEQEGPITIFVPTDEAFEELADGQLDELLKPENKEKLVELLKHHIVKERVAFNQLAQKSEITTASGKDLSIAIKDRKVMIDEATVTKADVACQNGLIHMIDGVLKPE